MTTILNIKDGISLKHTSSLRTKFRKYILFIFAISTVTATFSLIVIRNIKRGELKHPNVLLITIDALRADHLGCYGYSLETSPNIDRLAKSGVLFTDCTVQWPKTWPSMASMITGAYPKTTGIRIKRRSLPPSFNVMSEVFGEAGYTTGAVVANFNIGKKFGFDQGFDHFVESWLDMWKQKRGERPFKFRVGKIKNYTNATVVTDQAIGFLEGLQRNNPFFLWLHYMDPHGPYKPPKAYRTYFKGAHKREPIALEVIPRYQLRKRKGEPITNIGFYKAEYDREIRYLDDEIGRLLSQLDSLGFDSDTLIIFTADHGESLGDHDYYLEHGKLPYQPCAHIPLILVQKNVLPQGEKIKVPVGLIDVSATAVDLSGIRIPGSFEGMSLKNLILGEENAKAPDYVFMESGYHETGFHKTVRSGRWKLIHFLEVENPHTRNGQNFALYNIYEDPSELTNVASDHPEIVDRLKRTLEEWDSSGPRLKKGKEIDLDSLDERSREMLRSLGYIK
jgi:arylsulfatase A-like enzyme